MRRPPLFIAIAGVVVVALSTLVLTAFGPAAHVRSSASSLGARSAAPPEPGARAIDGTLLPAGAPDDVPVLLVHGYKGNARQLQAIADRLERDGRRVVEVTLPEHGTGDLRVAAFQLALAARDVGAPEVDMVGFSLGGLVARAWLLVDDQQVRIRHLVMVSVPNGGVALPEDSGLPYQESCETDKACGQLRPGSGFLRMLDDNPLADGRDDWLTIASDSDRLVHPATLVALTGARNLTVQEVCPNIEVDHGEMDNAPVVVGIVRLFLDEELPANPTCADALAAASN